jgi:hypothetical protein
MPESSKLNTSCSPFSAHSRGVPRPWQLGVRSHDGRVVSHSITVKKGGSLENAAAMANHASTRTTSSMIAGRDEMSLDEVERITI